MKLSNITIIKIFSFLLIYLLINPDTKAKPSLSLENSIDKVKKQVQSNLRDNYLPLLLDQFGSCSENPLECLKQVDDVVTLKTSHKDEICFPYTECGFYKCMEQKYQCDKVGVNYFTKLAYPTCRSYVRNLKEKKMFSPKGIEWIYTVMACLQVGLVDECVRDGNCEVARQTDIHEQKRVCEHITEFTLSFHPGCYIQSGVGVCHLPMKDKLNIWKTVSPFLTQRERIEAYKVVFHCIFRGRKMR